MNVKHIFVMAANLSGCGKGIVSASLGRLLKSYGYKVTIQKFDPYFNTSASSLNPLQHGEVSILADGHESDQDLGMYERFIDEELNKNNSITSGIIYSNVLQNEREGKYLGETIQVIPHITNEVKRYTHIFDNEYEIVIHEIGGNICDIEALPYIESIRQMQYELNNEDCLSVLLVYLPYLKTTKEVKTKIAQQGVEKCRSLGIIPDILICRSEVDFSNSIKDKLSLYSNIATKNIIKNLDASSIYEVPKMLMDEGIIEAVDNKLNLDLKNKDSDIDKWNNIVLNNYNNETVNIGLVGKYTALEDSYVSIVESLRFAGWKNKVNVNIVWIDSEQLENNFNLPLLKLDGIIIPGGFGKRGIEGMISACQYARMKKIPYLGICLGFQIMAIEFARNVLHLKDANSEEFNPKSDNLIIHIMDEQKNLKEMAGTLRLGNYLCKLDKNSIAYDFYKTTTVNLRHRHRYEFNNKYINQFKNNKVLISGVYHNNDNILVEMLELMDHPFMVGSQAHNEFNSKAGKPDALFDAFIFYAKNINRKIPN